MRSRRVLLLIAVIVIICLPQLHAQTPPLIKVPNLVGLTLADANRKLIDLSLQPSIKETRTTTDKAQDGKVFSQTPPANQTAGKRATVEIGVYKYQSLNERHAVPNLIGVSETEAVEALKKLGLKGVIITSEATEPGQHQKIFSHIPPAGISLNPGGIVRLMSRRYSAKAPAVVGMTESRAKEILAKAGFAWAVSPMRVFQQSDDGKVMIQTPVANQSKEAGAKILLEVGKYEAAVIVPSIVGMSFTQAEQVLKQNSLVVLNVSRIQVDDSISDGKVKAQSLQAGQKVVAGTRIDLEVFEATIIVPRIVGSKEDHAGQVLEKSGLKMLAGTLMVLDPSKDGIVATQAPLPGVRTAKGNSVAVGVYRYAAAAPVPNVIGAGKEEAKRMIERAGFVPNLASVGTADPAKNNTISSQSPAAGSSAPKGGVVALTFFKLTDSVMVPDVKKMKLEAAKKLLTDAGFVTSMRSVDTAMRALDDLVMEQVPAPGTEKLKGSTITLIAAKYSPAAINFSLRYVEAAGTYLLGVIGGAPPYTVKVRYPVAAPEAVKSVTIMGLQDSPGSQVWKYYRVSAKKAVKATFMVQDSVGNSREYTAELKAQK